MSSLEVEGVSKGIGDISVVVLSNTQDLVGSGVEQDGWQIVFFFTLDDGDPGLKTVKLSLSFMNDLSDFCELSRVSSDTLFPLWAGYKDSGCVKRIVKSLK